MTTGPLVLRIRIVVRLTQNYFWVLDCRRLLLRTGPDQAFSALQVLDGLGCRRVSCGLAADCLRTKVVGDDRRRSVRRFPPR
jgi:hypothetical protein